MIPAIDTTTNVSVELLAEGMQALTLPDERPDILYDLIFKHMLLEDVCSFGQVNSSCAHRALIEVRSRGYSWLREDDIRSGVEAAKHVHNVRMAVKEGQRLLFDYLTGPQLCGVEIQPPLLVCKTLDEALSNKEVISRITKVTLLSLNSLCGILLPPELEQFTALTKLECIVERKLKMVSPVVIKCKQLKSLSLACNGLTTLPSYMSKCSNLEELWLTNNKLNTIPSELNECKKLKEIYLMGNPLDKEFKSFAEKSFPNVFIKTEFDRLPSLGGLETRCF